MPTMSLAAALVYWVIVLLWLTVLATLLVFYVRNPRVFGTTRLLLAVVAIDTTRNIVENIYFGVYFGGQYGIFPAAVVGALGKPYLLVVPKLLNVLAGCVVLGLLLLRWLPASVREHRQSEQNVADLKILATTDGLTGLYNRRHFEAVARTEWRRSQRYIRPLSLLVIDADHFKSINDRFGHDVGDSVLKTIAGVCQSSKRDSDSAGRLGGEEFAILLPETSEAAARTVAERLCQMVRECSPSAGGEKINVTVSIGVATATLSMSGIGALMKWADTAMYEAKRSGRDRVVSAQVAPVEIVGVAAE
jgi:diguanylate cyclase (GGDEF)-like protein